MAMYRSKTLLCFCLARTAFAAAESSASPTCINKDGVATEECKSESNSLFQKTRRVDQAKVDHEDSVTDEDIVQGGGQRPEFLLQFSAAPKQQRLKRTTLNIERDLGSLHESYYLLIDPNASLEENANATLEHFLDKAGLNDELTGTESELYRERFLERLEELVPGGNTSNISNEDWRQDVRNSLEDEKPVVTLALVGAVNDHSFGWRAKDSPALSNMSMGDMKRLAGFKNVIHNNSALVQGKAKPASTGGDKFYCSLENGIAEPWLLQTWTKYCSIASRAKGFAMDPGCGRAYYATTGQQAKNNCGSNCRVYDENGNRCNAGGNDLHAATLDARVKWPECEDVIGRVRNQGTCGSCWAFAATNVVGSRLCIKSRGSFSGSSAYLSAGYVASCAFDAMSNSNNGCDGGNPVSAFNFMASNGVPTGGNGRSTCVPYFGGGSSLNHWTAGSQSPTCSTQTCQSEYPRSMQQDKFTPSGISQSFWTKDFNTATYNLYTYGPIGIVYQLYKDFMSYSSGIYRRTSNERVGGHVTVAIGYGPEYILSANSWGKDWGDNGNFKLHQGEVDQYAIPSDFESSGYMLPTMSETTATTTQPFNFQCHPADAGWSKPHWDNYCGLSQSRKALALTADCGSIWWGLGKGSEATAIKSCEEGSGQICYVFETNGNKCSSATPAPTPAAKTTFNWQCPPPAWAKTYWDDYCKQSGGKAAAMTTDCSSFYYAPSGDSAINNCESGSGQNCEVFDTNGEKCY